MRAAAYIDGFNLYYGLRAIRGRAPQFGENRWLDLRRLVQELAPRAELDRVRYFTARVEARAGDPGLPQRQDVYLRALETIPGVTIHFGTFLTHEVTLPLAEPSESQRWATVLRTEEKGSDVNLATYLLLDAFFDRYDLAVVVSNDSDLAEPVRAVRDELHRRVLVVSPQERVTARLRQAASDSRVLRPKVVARCQLPIPVIDALGHSIHPPPAWGPFKNIS
jgi:uncharacterized LabA/DUF88 family protein